MMLDDAATTRTTTATTKNDDGDGDGEEDEQWTTIEYDKCILIRMFSVTLRQVCLFMRTL